MNEWLKVWLLAPVWVVVQAWYWFTDLFRSDERKRRRSRS